MRVGMMLPTFTADGSLPLATARLAEDGGLDGLFAFDHLWPMGHPERPALWSFGVLGAVAAATSRISVGTLVARISLLPEDSLVSCFASLAAVAGPDRVIAGVGAGDRLSAAENEAYGIPHAPATDRFDAMARVIQRLRDLLVEVWVGGNSAAAGRLAAAQGVTRNLWGVTRDEFSRTEGSRKTWGGQVLIGRDQAEVDALRAEYGTRDALVSGTVREAADQLVALGATWCICTPLDYIRRPREAVETVCQVAEAVR